MRVWRVSPDKKRIEPVGILGKSGLGGGADGQTTITTIEEENVQEEDREEAEEESTDQVVRGVINDIGVFERGERGKDGLCIVVATGTEHRLGRWKTVKGKNGAAVFEVPRRRLENGVGNHNVKGEGDVDVDIVNGIN